MSTSAHDEGLYDALDKKGEEAAKEWFRSMAPALEDGAQEWVGTRTTFSDNETDVYWKIVHPVLLWRFFHHLSIILLAAANGWEEVYKVNSRKIVQERMDNDST